MATRNISVFMKHTTYQGVDLMLLSYKSWITSVNGQNLQKYWARLHLTSFLVQTSEVIQSRWNLKHLHLSCGALNLWMGLSKSTNPAYLRPSNITITDPLYISKAPVSLSTLEQPPTSNEISASTNQPCIPKTETTRITCSG